MGDDPWKAGALIPLDENGMSVVATNESARDGGPVSNAYNVSGGECTFRVSVVKTGFTAPNKTIMYDLKDIGGATVCIAHKSKHRDLLNRIAVRRGRAQVTFLPTVRHDSGDSAYYQFEGYVTKLVEITLTSNVEHIINMGGGVGIDTSVKSIFSKVYGKSLENGEAQPATPTEGISASG